nr:MAG TPA: hypothetical protein [Caudoviricetes sp.]
MRSSSTHSASRRKRSGKGERLLSMSSRGDSGRSDIGHLSILGLSLRV